MNKKRISPSMVIADVLKEWPQTIVVFQKHKMGCVGCVMSPFETVAEAAAIYELSLLKFLEELMRLQTEIRCQSESSFSLLP